MDANQEPFGIVAGGGNFPILCAKSAREANKLVIAIAHKGETSQEIERHAHVTKWVHLGQLGKIIKTLKKNGCKKALFAGTITKKRMFYDVRPDIRALSLWRKIGSRLDDSILRAVSCELEKEGIEIVPSTYFLDDLFTPKGILTRRRPTEDEEEDIKFGYAIQKKIGALDIGQTIVVKDRTVVAVEAMEGTDETIARGGRLTGQGAVVVKVAKPEQDLRFDLPSAGLGTIRQMIEAKARVLALEAGKSLFFDRDKAIELANQHGIAIVGIDPM